MFLYVNSIYRNFFILLLSCLLIIIQSCTQVQDTDDESTARVQDTADITTVARGNCSTKTVIESSDGIRYLALVVGVGQYKNPKIPDLAGPPQDAMRFYDLLTESNGYGFPKENVCLLLDEKATTANFKSLFQEILVKRARKQDVVVVYFAGHGSRVKDNNNDEADEWDETLMFHDARSGKQKDLVDDEFNALLEGLYKQTKNITILLDSCNSGTATRGDSEYTARFFDPPEDSESVASSSTEDAITEEAEWKPESMPGIVTFTAASDGTPALEKAGHGIFTDAILAALSETSDGPATYAQVARKIRPLIAAKSYQIPYFQGDLTRNIFGNSQRSRPVGWEVITTSPTLSLGGPPLPGIGVGAEFRIFKGNVSGSDARNPAKSKASIVIDEVTGLNAKAHIISNTKNAKAIEAGDLAILLRPADKFLKITASLRPSNQKGGIPEKLASQLQSALKNNPDAASVINFEPRGGEYELSLNKARKIIISGPENRVRNNFAAADDVIHNLWQHARQRALLQISSEGGSDFTENETLQVRLIPAPRQPLCADGIWDQKQPNQEQIIPLCHYWNIEVTLKKDSPKPLLIGGVILSTDGSSFGFPVDGRAVLLRPGQSKVFNSSNETFIGSVPLDITDHLMVFGTQENNPVPWHLITDTRASRAAGLAKHGLYRALDNYLTPGQRGVSRQKETVDETTWTLSSLTMRVEANTQFLKKITSSMVQNSREYTIKNFDIRPYLPDDETSTLYKVLTTADALARSSPIDGYGYKQHAWTKSNDKQNLKLGIDCSRSIWYAFTRSGLPYNKTDKYLTTGMMVNNDSRMADQFDRCDNDPELRLGDILVYRDNTRGDGHVVMVIDPEKRIAWGSHGWDGNSKILKIEPDTGVEYQQIKYKKDWARWDRTTMARKACWRYRKFESKTLPWPLFRGMLGQKALAKACDSATQCKI